MTPDANGLCVFAIKRGYIQSRIDVKNILFNIALLGTDAVKVPLGSLCLEEPCYGTSATAVKRTDDSQPKYIRITDFDDFGIKESHEFMAVESYSNKHLLRPNVIIC